MRPLVMQGLGYLFLVLGVVGLFLPFLQGFLFLFIGLVILAKYAGWARRLLDHLRTQHPRVDHWIERAETRLHHWGERIEGCFRR
jgi:uncharacterized membrane protein YbaN (DUF454 family)